MDGRDPTPGPWPTTPGGLGGGRGWAEVEDLVADLLVRLGDGDGPREGCGVSLWYLPFTDLGRADGEDCSWEGVLSARGEGDTHVALAGDPVGALEELHLVGLPVPHPSVAADGPVVRARTGRGGDLARRWAGWSVDLRRLAEAAATGPAPADEPSPAGFDVAVRWRTAGAPDGGGAWAWEVGGVEMLDGAGEAVGEVTWPAATPSRALRDALADVPHWYEPWATWGGARP